LDFSWAQSLSLETKSEIEEVSNLAIRKDLNVVAQYMSLPEAKKWGAVALFGETYDESVRVVEIGGPWSRELCGGTHVDHSSQIGMISIMGESSVGSGSRRIEALVGIEAFRAFAVERALVSRLTEVLKSPREQLEERISSTIEDLKQAQRKLASLQAGAIATRIPEFIDKATTVGVTKVVVADLGEANSVEDLRSLSTGIRERISLENAVSIAVGVIEQKPMLVVATTQSARETGIKAGLLVRAASAVLGGGGGGKDDLAQGGGADATKISLAIEAIKEAIKA
jgi:alanyl-tRNA synthetase